jgi:TonB family protein
MTDRKKCVRCDRPIDAWAGICPFCNHNQLEPVPAAVPTPSYVADYKPPDDKEMIKKKLGMVAIGILLLFVAFGVGLLINQEDAPENAPPPVAEQGHDIDVSSGKRADTQLVPVGEPIAQPITSAPVAQLDASIPTEYQRHDATAVSSVEYQQLAARAQAEKKNPAAAVDPRSITGRAYAQQPVRPARRSIAQAQAQRAPSTHPVAEYQPVPAIRVRQPMTVRLNLTVGPDGRVQDVAMLGNAGRETSEILSTVRRWRYKPATVNGQPVSAPVTVDISFKDNE